VILVHHEGYQGGRVRGHSSVTGLVDCSIGVESRDDAAAESNAKTTWLRLYNDKQRNEERAEPMILTLEKPLEDLEAALITGRPDPEREQKLLPLFAKKDKKAVAKADGALPFDGKERAFLEALRAGATTPKEIRELTGLPNGTEFNRRKALIEREWITWDGQTITLTAVGDAAFVRASNDQPRSEMGKQVK
jgi:hypothetical protein